MPVTFQHSKLPYPPHFLEARHDPVFSVFCPLLPLLLRSLHPGVTVMSCGAGEHITCSPHSKDVPGPTPSMSLLRLLTRLPWLQPEQQLAFFLPFFLFCFVLTAPGASGSVCLSTMARISSALAISLDGPGSDLVFKCVHGGKWLPGSSVLCSLFITWKGNQQQVGKNQLYYKPVGDGFVT